MIKYLKKYVAKYLLVEGEINRGDMVIDYTLPKRAIAQYLDEDEFINDRGEIVNLPKWKERFHFRKVKMFICSKDVTKIKEDDKIVLPDFYVKFYEDIVTEIATVTGINEENEVIHFKRKSNFSLFGDKEERCHSGVLIKDNPMKLMGEISPEAIWVKEGDEFDDTEIQEWYWHIEQNHLAVSVKFAEEISNKPPNFVPNAWEKNTDVFSRNIFTIKGPCGHFH